MVLGGCGSNQQYHFGVGTPPILAGIGMFTGGTIWTLAHGQMKPQHLSFRVGRSGLGEGVSAATTAPATCAAGGFAPNIQERPEAGVGSVCAHNQKMEP